MKWRQRLPSWPDMLEWVRRKSIRHQIGFSLAIFFLMLMYLHLNLYAVFSIINPRYVIGPLTSIALILLVSGIWLAARFFPLARKKGGLILASIPVCIFASVLLPRLFFLPPQNLIDRTRFQIFKSEYAMEKTSPSATTEKRFKIFPWGLSILHVLVYDESDEVGDPRGKKSDEWWRRVGMTSDFRFCTWASSRVEEHYYVVDLNCE